ncbi:tRNA (N6-threonylcarbamoyladenosine(37)-N6)-methyltransferase TrmO [Thermodesulfobacteriota bacterium]
METRIEMKPIGHVHTDAEEIPRTCHISDVEGWLVLDKAYIEGLRDIKPGQRVYVIFHFHRSPRFTPDFMRIKPPTRDKEMGVFSTHSPFRPNPIGLSVLKVLRVESNLIHVKGMDMFDGTPVLDIKPASCAPAD